ncbi:MAG: glycosyltransferase family 92 protein [Desulfovibrio sp.]|nr:glycosyltransferase family 92 protein [Desulfovibrio sp.]
MYYASVCAIAKDEDLDIREWILYHFSIGFEHFYIYDNNSKKRLKDFLYDFIASGIVTVIDFPGNESQQLSAYYHCIKKIRNSSFWIAFIDVDEFIVPLEKSDIKDFLDDYVDYAGVALSWMVFSSNKHLLHQKSVIKSYTEVLGLDKHIKTIVQTKYVINPLSPHHFKFQEPRYCVNEDFVPVLSFSSYPLANKIRINHYYFKSQQDFEMKIERGLATKIKNVEKRDLSAFYDHIAKPTKTNTDIFRFLPIYEKYSKNGIPFISHIINTEVNKNYDDEFVLIDNYIKEKDFSNALKKCRDLKRHFYDHNLYVIEILILILSNNFEMAKKMISDLIIENSNNKALLSLYYEQLSKLYTCMNMPNDADSVIRYIQEK